MSKQLEGLVGKTIAGMERKQDNDENMTTIIFTDGSSFSMGSHRLKEMDGSLVWRSKGLYVRGSPKSLPYKALRKSMRSLFAPAWATRHDGSTVSIKKPIVNPTDPPRSK